MSQGLSFLAKPAPPFITPCDETLVSPYENNTAGAKRFEATVWIGWLIGTKSGTFIYQISICKLGPNSASWAFVLKHLTSWNTQDTATVL